MFYIFVSDMRTTTKVICPETIIEKNFSNRTKWMKASRNINDSKVNNYNNDNNQENKSIF